MRLRGEHPAAVLPHVAMVTSLFPPSIGGIQTHTWKVSEALAQRGARVTVITRHHAGLLRREERGGCTILRVGRGDASRAVATGSYVLEAFAALAKLCVSVDVVHVQQMLSPLTVGLAAKSLLRIPLVVNPHACGAIGDVSQAGLARGRAARRLADAFISISRPIRAELTDLGVPAARIFDIPNGVDTHSLRPASKDERDSLRHGLGLPRGPLVVYAGRLAPEKGPDVLLDAWPQLARARPDAHLLLLGTGALAGALRARIAGVPALAHVTLGGGVSDVGPYLRAADAFVLPSRSEGLPVALLEAMACGLPCVATRVGGSIEVLEDGQSGELVASGDAPALARALERALQLGPGSPQGTHAREVCLQRYSLDRVASAYLALYAQLLEGVAFSSAMVA